jgi:hypothetical protein
VEINHEQSTAEWTSWTILSFRPGMQKEESNRLEVRGRHKIAQLGKVLVKLEPCMPSRVLEVLSYMYISRNQSSSRPLRYHTAKSLNGGAYAHFTCQRESRWQSKVLTSVVSLCCEGHMVDSSTQSELEVIRGSYLPARLIIICVLYMVGSFTLHILSSDYTI